MSAPYTVEYTISVLQGRCRLADGVQTSGNVGNTLNGMLYGGMKRWNAETLGIFCTVGSRNIIAKSWA